MKRKIFAGIVLIMLMTVPFLNWRLGAVMWMGAWFVFLYQKLFDRQSWMFGEGVNRSDSYEDQHQE